MAIDTLIKKTRSGARNVKIKNATEDTIRIDRPTK